MTKVVSTLSRARSSAPATGIGAGPRRKRRALADFVFASEGVVLDGNRALDLDLPPLAEVGAQDLDRRARQELTHHEGAVVAGLVPFDPRARPELFVLPEPTLRPCPEPERRKATPTTSSRASADRRDADLAEREDTTYVEAVAAALRDIEAGRLQKVVLARSLDLPVSIAPEDVWARLAARNPHADTFAVRRADGVFLGASPELVAEIGPEGFATHPLAGSTPRGLTAAADAALGSALLASDKDRREHRFVIDHIVQRLRPLLGRLDVPAGPSLFATDAMMHLGTRLTGQLRPGAGSLEAALTIHPTPAVCGVPAPQALTAIRRLEPGDRGPYAGLVGWTDARGYGRWALALRCAELRAGSARLFAGAGVVAGSTPAGEHAETAAKFATMTAALTAPEPVSGTRVGETVRMTGTAR